MKQNISQFDDKANFTAIHVDEAVSVVEKEMHAPNNNMDSHALQKQYGQPYITTTIWTILNTRGAMHHGKMDDHGILKPDFYE